MFVLPPRRCADRCHRGPPFKKSYKKEVRSFVPHTSFFVHGYSVFKQWESCRKAVRLQSLTGSKRRHARRIGTEEYLFVQIDDNDGEGIVRIYMPYVLISFFLQCGNQIFQFLSSFPMDVKLFHKKYLSVYSAERHEKKAHRTMGFFNKRCLLSHRSAFGTLQTQVAVRSKGLSLAHSLWCVQYNTIV